MFRDFAIVPTSEGGFVQQKPDQTDESLLQVFLDGAVYHGEKTDELTAWSYKSGDSVKARINPSAIDPTLQVKDLSLNSRGP